MSDTGTPDSPKPAKQARKSAPRRRKPANKAVQVETTGPGTPAADATPHDANTTTTAPHGSNAEGAADRPATPLTSAAMPTPHPAVATAAKSATATATPKAPVAAPQPNVLIRVPMAVRWRDLDAFNHVNNSQYLSYLEEARLQWMVTLPGQGLDDHVAPVVAAANLNYRRPIEWPNEVMIELFVERLGNTSLSIGHRIVARDDASVLFCDGNVVMVWIDRGTGSAAPFPTAVRDACR